jgi:hypothetical protein
MHFALRRSQLNADGGALFKSFTRISLLTSITYLLNKHDLIES